jgi:hypothetical protein
MQVLVYAIPNRPEFFKRANTKIQEEWSKSGRGGDAPSIDEMLDLLLEVGEFILLAAQSAAEHTHGSSEISVKIIKGDILLLLQDFLGQGLLAKQVTHSDATKIIYVGGFVFHVTLDFRMSTGPVAPTQVKGFRLPEACSLGCWDQLDDQGDKELSGPSTTICDASMLHCGPTPPKTTTGLRARALFFAPAGPESTANNSSLSAPTDTDDGVEGVYTQQYGWSVKDHLIEMPTETKPQYRIEVAKELLMSNPHWQGKTSDKETADLLEEVNCFRLTEPEAYKKFTTSDKFVTTRKLLGLPAHEEGLLM